MKCRICFWTQKPLAIAAAFLRFRATPIPTEFKMTEREELRAATYVCDRLDMSLATLDRRLADPRADLPRPVTKWGRARMWRKAEVDRYAAQHERSAICFVAKLP